MKAVIFFSGLAGLLIFGPPVFLARHHHRDISVVVHELTPVQVVQGGQGDCRFEAERRVSVPAGPVDLFRLRAGSGSLRVVGVEGRSEIQAVGRACASEQEFLEAIQLSSEMDGSTLVMETLYPRLTGWSGGNRYARLDLTVEVPMGLAADIQDGSGAVELSGLGNVDLTDGSGEAIISGIRGDLSVRDGSGELEIRDVSGRVSVEDGSGEILLESAGSDVEIRDSSGGLEIHGVGGSLTLRDSSGEIDVSNVTGSVLVLGDGSGSIDVVDVGGDFVVEHDGSGSIRHEGVQGTVDIPKKRRGR